MTIMTGSKLSIFSHPGKITGYWITTRSFPYRPGSIWASTLYQANMGVSFQDSVSGQYGGLGMITRPIWKCPCINLYIFFLKS